MSAPQLVALLPSEDLLQTIVQADRRFSLHRLIFDLYSAAFPARVPQLVVTLVFCGGTGEYSGALTVAGPGGDILIETPFTFTARTYHVQAVNLSGLQLPEPGPYRLTAVLEGQPMLVAPLVAVQLKPGEDQEITL